MKPVLRGHIWGKDKRPLKRGLIHIKFSMTRQEKGDLLIQVTAWAGLTVIKFYLVQFSGIFINKTLLRLNIVNSNMTSFFRFLDKRAIYR